MIEHEDKSTPDSPGEAWAVDTLDGAALTRADRWIRVAAEFADKLRQPGSTDIELGTEGHGLGVVRYRQVRQDSEHVFVFERVSS